MKRLNGLAIGTGLIVAGAVGGVALAAAYGSPSPAATEATPPQTDHIGDWGAMMGGKGAESPAESGMMTTAMNRFMGHARSAWGRAGWAGGAMMATSGGVPWTPAQVGQLVRQSAQQATIDHATNTVTYHGAHPVLVVLAAPAALHGPGMPWEIDGLINPTVVIPPGARVTVVLINGDQGDLHGFEVTTASPPFGEMAMMQGPVAFSGSFIPPIWPETGQGQYHRSTTFIAAVAGTYHYLCPVPGHAEAGMAGTLVVS